MQWKESHSSSEVFLLRFDPLTSFLSLSSLLPLFFDLTLFFLLSRVSLANKLSNNLFEKVRSAGNHTAFENHCFRCIELKHAS